MATSLYPKLLHTIHSEVTYLTDFLMRTPRVAWVASSLEIGLIAPRTQIPDQLVKKSMNMFAE